MSIIILCVKDATVVLPYLLMDYLKYQTIFIVNAPIEVGLHRNKAHYNERVWVMN